MTSETIGVLVGLAIFSMSHLLLANRWGARMDERVKALTKELHGSVVGIEKRLDILADELREIATRASRVALVERDVIGLKSDIVRIDSLLIKLTDARRD